MPTAKAKRIEMLTRGGRHAAERHRIELRVIMEAAKAKAFCLLLHAVAAAAAPDMVEG